MSALSKYVRLRTSQVACVVAASSLVLAACGSSSDSGSNGSEGDSGADVATAKAQVKKFSEPMTSVYLPPVEKKPAPGKKIAVIVNNQPQSATIKDGAVAAAKALGWTVVPIVYDGSSPTGATQAFAQAVSESPDGVITQALNVTDYAQAAKTFKANNIPVVTSNTTDPVEAPIVANVTDAAQIELSGRLAAAYVIAEKGDKASVAMFNIPAFTILGVFEDAFKKEYLKLCPKCHYESHAVQASDIGTKVPSQVVSAVQSNPSINFAGMGFGSVALGVSGALKSAGLEDVKIVGIAPAIENIAAVSKGTEDMWVGLPITAIGWKSIDALVRHYNGEDVEIATKAQTPFQIITKSNVGAKPEIPEIAGYEDIFKKLWLVD